MNDTLFKFKEIIDDEIQAYESLGELYRIKQSILVQGNSDALWDIDAQIVSKSADIKRLNLRRKEVAGYLGNENLTMSEAIEQAKIINDELANNLQSQKKKLNILSKSLELQETTNMTLIQHGLTMVGKTIDIIVGAILPSAQQYDKSGKNIESDRSSICSIMEEA